MNKENERIRQHFEKLAQYAGSIFDRKDLSLSEREKQVAELFMKTIPYNPSDLMEDELVRILYAAAYPSYVTRSQPTTIPGNARYHRMARAVMDSGSVKKSNNL